MPDNVCDICTKCWGVVFGSRVLVFSRQLDAYSHRLAQALYNKGVAVWLVLPISIFLSRVGKEVHTRRRAGGSATYYYCYHYYYDCYYDYDYSL